MKKYDVLYVSYGSCGTTSKQAASASDAKAMVESTGASVYEVRGPEGTIKFMSYSEAVEIQKRRR
jgi:hypothetical protein